jgi:hypothetical protein
MMHGREKSDPAIVAMKPTNKAEQSAAESVERRAGTKGNAGQQSDPSTISTRAQLTSAARDLGVELVVFEAQNPAEIDGPLNAIAVARVEAVNVLASPQLNAARHVIIERTRNARLPAIYQFPETINLKTAKALGIDVPALLQQRADEVIE